MRVIFSTLVVMVCSLPSSAQERIAGFSAAGSAPAWGISNQSVAVSLAFTFQGTDGGPLTLFPNAYRFKSDDKPVIASFSTLPAGALITGVQVEGCDTSATDAISFEPAYITESGLVSLSGQAASTGLTATPGCGFFDFQLPVPHASTQSNAYIVVLRTTGSANARYAAVRLFYRLQVSPAPATNTFSDVPVGAPFHRFVEAFAAAGLTGGCGGGNYCPDHPVSRAQVAVFVAVALGLYFPNQ